MRKLSLLLVFVIIFAAFGALSYKYSQYQNKLASADKLFLSLKFQDADESYRNIEDDLKLPVRYLPSLLRQDSDYLELKRLQSAYEQGHYDRLIDEIPAVENIDKEPEIQFILGDALYRKVEKDTDRTRVLNAIESAIKAYVKTLEENPDHFNAAFNYEYLLRIRDRLQNNKMPLPVNKSKQKQKQEKGDKKSDDKGDNETQAQGDSPSIHGQPGETVGQKGKINVKVYVPLTGEEGERQKKSPGETKGDAGKKKG